MYTDYWVSAKITLDTYNNKTKIISLYPLANSSEMAKEKLITHVNNEYGKDYIKNIEFIHSFATN